jgi:hypothetical protein
MNFTVESSVPVIHLSIRNYLASTQSGTISQYCNVVCSSERYDVRRRREQRYVDWTIEIAAEWSRILCCFSKFDSYFSYSPIKHGYTLLRSCLCQMYIIKILS